MLKARKPFSREEELRSLKYKTNNTKSIALGTLTIFKTAHGLLTYMINNTKRFSFVTKGSLIVTTWKLLSVLMR